MYKHDVNNMRFLFSSLLINSLPVVHGAGFGAAGWCFQEFTANSTFWSMGGCPDDCPVLSACTSGGASICVPPDDCNKINVGAVAIFSDGKFQCDLCKAGGCQQCETGTQCAICQEDFIMVDGECIWNGTMAWRACWAVVFILWMWFMIDTCRTHWSSNKNSEALAAGLRHRSRAHVRNNDAPGQPFYPVSVNFHRYPICGPGMSLFMNWWLFLGGVSLYLAVVAFALQEPGPSQPDPEAEKAMFDLCDTFVAKRSTGTNSSGYMTATREFNLNNIAVSRGSDSNVMMTAAMYFGACIFTVIFFIYQRRTWIWLDDQNVNSSDFAVEIKGLPTDATNKAEIIKYLDDCLQQLGVEGQGNVCCVSIAYTYYDHQDLVDELIDNHLRAVDCPDNRRFSVLASLPPSTFKPTPEGNEGQGPKSFWIQILAYIMIGCDFDFGGIKQPGSVGIPERNWRSEDVRAFLLSLPSSGRIIVCFKTEKIADTVVSGPKWKEMPLKFRGTHTIKVREIEEQPRTVLWHNYGVPRKERRRRIENSIIIMIIILVIWFALYFPFSYYTLLLSSFDVGDSTQHDPMYLIGGNEAALGLIIALGNALVGFSVVLLCEYVGAHHKWKQDVIALIIIVPCVMINIICDLYVTIRNVFTMWERDYPGTDLANDWGFIMGYGLQAINWHLFYLLIPGYVFVPYVGEPLATMLLPYWIGVWRVKSDPRIDSRMAERIMVGGDIDIINPPYCDIICCTATMFLTLMLPTSYQSTLFMWLWFFAVFLYWLNRKRILRWHSHTEFNSRKVDVTEAHLWSFPLALLAAAWGQQLAWSTSNCREDGMDLNTCTVAPLGWVFLVVHAVIHLLFTFLVLPLLDPPHKPNETNTYDEIVKPRPDNYRNTNPIEVLRSIHIKEYEDEQLTFYKVGKEYLQHYDTSSYYENEKEAKVGLSCKNCCGLISPKKSRRESAMPEMSTKPVARHTIKCGSTGSGTLAQPPPINKAHPGWQPQSQISDTE